jgi:hypothetical protein
MAAGFANGGRPDLAQLPLGDDSRRRWAQIRELEELGAAPVDGRPPRASSTSTPTKASVRWGFSSSRDSSPSSTVMAGYEEDNSGGRFAKDLGASV